MAKLVVLYSDSEACERASLYLQVEGHVVRSSSSAAEAIDLGHLFKPDGFLVDPEFRDDYSCLEVVEAMQAACPSTEMFLIPFDKLNQIDTDFAVFDQINRSPIEG